MRALYERTEDQDIDQVGLEELLSCRSWTAVRLKSLLQTARRRGLVQVSGGQYALTAAGEEQATRIVRNHRLWELYLINYADIAPSHVDRDADKVEHVLDPQTITRLEELLKEEDRAAAKLTSPHPIGTGELS
jgi:Mn-dependent DtxR family transcriptional regulator